jgi:Ala-tRNA(Pro) deacylase
VAGRFETAALHREGTVRARALDELLKNAHVPFTTFQHPIGYGAQYEAARSHVPGRLWAKTVICIADDRPVAAVVPAHLLVDLERLRALAGATTVRLAREAELIDCCPDEELGATSPFAGGCRWRVFVDRSFVGEPEMVFSAGTHTDAIRLHYWDFAELARPVVGDLTVPLVRTRRAPRIRPTMGRDFPAVT